MGDTKGKSLHFSDFLRWHEQLGVKPASSTVIQKIEQAFAESASRVQTSIYLPLCAYKEKKAAFHFCTYWPRMSLKCGSSSMWYFLRYPYSSSVPRTFAMRTSWNKRHVQRAEGQPSTLLQRQSCPNLRALLLEPSRQKEFLP